MDFEQFTLRDAEKLVAPVDAGVDAEAQANVHFYNGDHWQEGKGWTGPWPQAASEKSAALRTTQTMQTEIKRGFVAKNTIKEVTDRHVNGVLGRQVHWKFAPRAMPEGIAAKGDTEAGETVSPQDQALIDEAESLLVDWWETRQIDEVLQWAATSLLLKRKAFLRLFIPASYIDENGMVAFTNIEDALDAIYVHHPGYDEETETYQTPQATVHTDKRSRKEIGIYLYKDEQGQTEAEISYLNENGETVIQILKRGEAAEATMLDMGGHLAHYLLRRPVLIDETVRSQQRLINLALSMKHRNVVVGGFLERTLLNAKLPGKFGTNPVTGNEEFIPDPIYFGAEVVNNFVGQVVEDESGNPKLAQPSIIYRDPSPVEVFETTERSAYVSLLQQTHQLHYAIAGDATASGESRKQAREAFEMDLQKTASKIQNAVQWILEASIALAASLIGQARRYESLRVFSECRIDPGPLSADEQRVLMDAGDRRYLSRERVMSQAFGVEDVDAERQRIEAEDELSDNVLAQLDASVQSALGGGTPENEPMPTAEGTPTATGNGNGRVT